MRIIAGKYRNRSIQTLKGQNTRPTLGKLREAVFNMCQAYLEEAVFLDVFAGSGAMGLEALSRGAAHCCFVEKHPHAIRCIKQNIASLDVDDQCTVLPFSADIALKKLQQQNKQFDIIYIDPPYATKGKEDYWSIEILKQIDQSQMMNEGAWIFLEELEIVPINKLEFKQLRLEKVKSFGKSQLYLYIRV